jgi:solute carrier family 19 (thiamine transporter), member 2/3
LKIFFCRKRSLIPFFAAQAVSLIVAISLPSVGISLYFYAIPEKSDGSSDSNDSKESETRPKLSLTRAYNLLWKHFLESYSNPKIVQWSFWWALAMAGFLMVQIYVQLLWQEIDQSDGVLLNAGVEAALTLFGAIAAFLAGFLTSKTFKKFDLWVLTLCSLLQGVFIIVSSQTTSIWVAYAMYILFGVLYSFMITIASASVAEQLADDSFALIFGINTLLALIFQTTLTIVVIQWLGLGKRDQFLVYGFYFVGLSAVYFVFSLVQLLLCRRREQYSLETE